MLIAMLGNANDYPALYPCPDMFIAPFLARMTAVSTGGSLEGRKTGGRYSHEGAIRTRAPFARRK